MTRSIEPSWEHRTVYGNNRHGLKHCSKARYKVVELVGPEATRSNVPGIIAQAMSQATPIPSSSSSSFQSILTTALDAYEKRTKKKLLIHPLIAQLQSCDSPDAILTVLQQIIQQFDQSRGNYRRLTSWLGPTVNVLYAFSATLSAGVSLVFSPAQVIFAGIGVLLLAAKDVHNSQNALAEIFERIECFFRRLETYTEVSPTTAMIDIIVKILVEVLSILAIATKEIRQRRPKKYLMKLIGKNDIEDALKRLDQLTQEEARMATVEVLKVTHRVDDNVKVLIDGTQNEFIYSSPFF
ncbi:hypothetical protein BJV74DRAFT_794486 [Russula compacta]|nr:hypothetical protein BJV74DRAFT_794486 [Russula compacta]